MVAVVAGDHWRLVLRASLSRFFNSSYNVTCNSDPSRHVFLQDYPICFLPTALYETFWLFTKKGVAILCFSF